MNVNTAAVPAVGELWRDRRDGEVVLIETTTDFLRNEQEPQNMSKLACRTLIAGQVEDDGYLRWDVGDVDTVEIRCVAPPEWERLVPEVRLVATLDAEAQRSGELVCEARAAMFAARPGRSWQRRTRHAGRAGPDALLPAQRTSLDDDDRPGLLLRIRGAGVTNLVDRVLMHDATLEQLLAGGIQCQGYGDKDCNDLGVMFDERGFAWCARHAPGTHWPRTLAAIVAAKT